MNDSLVAKTLEISGVVQGVGFRPFLFVLAKKYHLKGEVSNTSGGVRVRVEGQAGHLDGFIHDIDRKSPLLASVTAVKAKAADVNHFDAFKIVKSLPSAQRTTLISPDVTVCQDCLAEMKNPSDRRYNYPFINCTNCGPRYTIIEDIPYDRPKTSMKYFNMCAACQKEYDNPLDRRFHAQPNACPDCGPQVILTDREGVRIESDPKEAILLAAAYLNQGKILGVKGLGGFHLACDATNPAAVETLRHKKVRPHKPFALMAQAAGSLFDDVNVSAAEKELLESYHRPIVLLKKKAVRPGQVKGIAQGVAPFNNSLGIMLPYTPLHYLLLENGPDILVMTSGNRSGEPLSISNDDARDALSHIADFFLFHNRDIYFRADDSITRVQAGKTRFIRRSRGYAPLPVMLDRDMPNVLGCGAGLKNTICLTRKNQAFLSQHIGDLENVKAYDFYQDSIDHLKQILDIRPDIIAHDLHPGYMSTEYADSLENVKKIAVQHHHAHAVACMAENHLDEAVIAITLDGTGYGTDGNIWGGEILVCTQHGFKRAAHLSYVRMPGGDAAVLEPWRMAASVLYKAFGSEFLNLDLPFLKEVGKDKLSFVCRMMEKHLNAPLTSSAGRLFDAVASLLCVRHKISHESQAAMELESLAHDCTVEDRYEFRILKNEADNPAGCTDQDRPNKIHRPCEIDMMPCIRQITEDLNQGMAPDHISMKFHHTVVQAFLEAAENISEKTGIRKIVLSGGVFNNDIILTGMISKLEKKQFKVYSHTQVPCGDGGISLGQVVVAARLKGNG